MNVFPSKEDCAPSSCSLVEQGGLLLLPSVPQNRSSAASGGGWTQTGPATKCCDDCQQLPHTDTEKGLGEEQTKQEERLAPLTSCVRMDTCVGEQN